MKGLLLSLIFVGNSALAGEICSIVPYGSDSEFTINLYNELMTSDEMDQYGDFFGLRHCLDDASNTIEKNYCWMSGVELVSPKKMATPKKLIPVFYSLESAQFAKSQLSALGVCRVCKQTRRGKRCTTSF